MTTVTHDQALEALATAKQAEMQREADAAVEAERLEQERQKALAEAQNRAAAILEERNSLIPQFVEALTQVGELATQLRGLRDEHSHLTARCRKLGGDTETQWPRQFGVDPHEREVLRQALQILSSVGGYI